MFFERDVRQSIYAYVTESNSRNIKDTYDIFEVIHDIVSTAAPPIFPVIYSSN